MIFESESLKHWGGGLDRCLRRLFPPRQTHRPSYNIDKLCLCTAFRKFGILCRQTYWAALGAARVLAGPADCSHEPVWVKHMNMCSQTCSRHPDLLEVCARDSRPHRLHACATTVATGDRLTLWESRLLTTNLLNITALATYTMYLISWMSAGIVVTFLPSIMISVTINTTNGVPFIRIIPFIWALSVIQFSTNQPTIQTASQPASLPASQPTKPQASKVTRAAVSQTRRPTMDHKEL